MPEPKTMVVEQGQCQIYPEALDQMCVRVKVLVMQLKPGETADAAWVDDGDPVRAIDLHCGQAGLNRLLHKIDDGTKPPTPRQKRGTKADG